MKAIEETKTVIVGYEAVDGTYFPSKEECEKYEQSAIGVLKGRLAQKAIATMSECELFKGGGSDENMSFIVIPKNEEDVAMIQQILYLKAFSKEIQANKVAVGKILAVTFSYDDECAWVTDLGELISDATNGAYTIKPVEE